ncbi:MAG: Glycosyl transferase family 2 [Candidatus Amesbacteria bacterium GW2011_GWA1_47_16]|uniref:Glycosyl transferase family 2 n=4 Tax=Candidatus Amesiibacteriota TaxID=1752730 RepID=A0A0G1S4R1_9BACT|nr:MAG: Glycosyl transferase family 2 [Candidatus Amesbacteria bacterium GW2011_GWC1_47_15]KKU64549.1 MAG: Glycosyl transferase family 2 [Candidatus Amesbacteria bacterium GW2011_GWA1_47_16]KKU98094.1 MAG: Glycosyl transferase family 2 [Candidatus Amesbacteria bacterium GW2011_GWB1_48_13]OGC98806.1 MAG: hypothetical protein A2701_02460 [Candidatus Amesbacteria bacterium RIFCSPHIGHO2_01_FULL_47_34]OGD00622.1 MAG: hypothetical protein A2972_02065 [Candidatus Amesbacteria bacterium RIFCSPLOWO2_01_
MTINTAPLQNLALLARKHEVFLVSFFLAALSAATFLIYYSQGLTLAYNDARSHLDIGRRIVEGLKPGFAQIGSVWLPLPHFLMTFTIWNDFMWHSGLAGSIQSMVSFVATGILIYLFLRRLGVGTAGRLAGLGVFAFNTNVLYLQTTAMTELLLLATMTAGSYKFLAWYQEQKLPDLILSAFWFMLATLIRYDGWFLVITATLLVAWRGWKKGGWQVAEGMTLMFSSLGFLGIALWLLWNQLIFNNFLYFAISPYSAYAQQQALLSQGNLATKGQLLVSFLSYLSSLVFSHTMVVFLLGIAGAAVLWLDKKNSLHTRIAALCLLAPFVFNIISLYLGQSAMFIPGLSGGFWFNVRYGIMLAPSVAIFIGLLIDRLKNFRPVIGGILIFVMVFSHLNQDTVALEDARSNLSYFNVSSLSDTLNQRASQNEGFILLSTASHETVIFGSSLPMKRFITEGTGLYWQTAIVAPHRLARWIVMQTDFTGDLVWKSVSSRPEVLVKYYIVGRFPTGDLYEIKPEYLPQLSTTPIYSGQK